MEREENRCSPTDTLLLGSELDFSEIESIPEVPVEKQIPQRQTTKIVFNNTIVPEPTKLTAQKVIVPDANFKIPKKYKNRRKNRFYKKQGSQDKKKYG